MANDAEIPRLLVRLTADNQQLLKSLDGSLKAVQSFATKALGFLGIVASVKGLLGAAHAAESTELKMDQLRIAIGNNGKAVEETVAEYRKFASEIERNTTLTKGEVTAMLKRAEVMGLDTRTAEAAVKNAIALSGALGGEAADYMRASTALAAGNKHLVARMLGLRGVKNETELTARIDKVLTTGLQQAEKAGRTSQAAMDRLGRTFDRVKVLVGGVIAEGLTPFLDILADLSKEYKDAEGSTTDFWANAREQVHRWALAGAFMVRNIAKVWEFLYTKVAYYLELMYEYAVHVFEERIPNAAQRLGLKLTGKLLNIDVNPMLNALPKAAAFSQSALAESLSADADKLGADLAIGMDKFVTDGMNRFRKNGYNLGRKAGEGIGRGVVEGLALAKIEGTLAFSLEAFQKQAEFFATGSVGGDKGEQRHKETLSELQKQTGYARQTAENTAGTEADLGGYGG